MSVSDAIVNSPGTGWLLVAAAIVVNSTVLLWPADFNDSQCYATLLRMAATADREQGFGNGGHANDEDRHAVLEELQSLVESLEDKASAREPARQQLLWAGREFLLPALQGRTPLDEQGMKLHMDKARSCLWRNGIAVDEFIIREDAKQ